MTANQLVTEVQSTVVIRKLSVEDARPYAFALKQRIIAEAETPEHATSRLSDLVDCVRLLATRAANEGRYRESLAYDAIADVLRG